MEQTDRIEGKRESNTPFRDLLSSSNSETDVLDETTAIRNNKRARLDCNDVIGSSNADDVPLEEEEEEEASQNSSSEPLVIPARANKRERVLSTRYVV